MQITSWDTLSYILYMGHSVYNHITAVQEANRLTDIEKHRLNWSTKTLYMTRKAKQQMIFRPMFLQM